MTKPFRTGEKFAIVGGPNVENEPKGEQLSSYGSWRVVRADDYDHLICAFYGGASLSAASIFFEAIEADPAWSVGQ